MLLLLVLLLAVVKLSLNAADDGCYCC